MVESPFADREILDDVQSLEQDDALRRQRLLVDVAAVVGDLERVVPVGLGLLKVGLVDDAASFGVSAGDALRGLASVEAIALILNDAAQRVGQLGLDQALARLVGDAFFEESQLHRLVGELRTARDHPRRA